MNIKRVEIAGQTALEALKVTSPKPTDIKDKTIPNVSGASGASASEPTVNSGLKAVFALDGGKNVVIRLIDKNGKTIIQFPPEQLIKMSDELKLPLKNLLNEEV